MTNSSGGSIKLKRKLFREMKRSFSSKEMLVASRRSFNRLSLTTSSGDMKDLLTSHQRLDWMMDDSGLGPVEEEESGLLLAPDIPDLSFMSKVMLVKQKKFHKASELSAGLAEKWDELQDHVKVLISSEILRVQLCHIARILEQGVEAVLQLHPLAGGPTSNAPNQVKQLRMNVSDLRKSMEDMESLSVYQQTIDIMPKMEAAMKRVKTYRANWDRVVRKNQRFSDTFDKLDGSGALGPAEVVGEGNMDKVAKLHCHKVAYDQHAKSLVQAIDMVLEYAPNIKETSEYSELRQLCSDVLFSFSRYLQKFKDIENNLEETCSEIAEMLDNLDKIC